MTLKRKFPTETEAKFGTNVVNGYSATLAFTSAIQLISEDFPTLGVQISPKAVVQGQFPFYVLALREYKNSDTDLPNP